MSNLNPYKDDEIRQLIPIPECLTPMGLEYDENDNRVYVDNSGFVYYALMRNQDTAFYLFFLKNTPASAGGGMNSADVLSDVCFFLP